MLVDRYEAEDVFARVPELAEPDRPSACRSLTPCSTTMICTGRCVGTWRGATA